MTVKNYIVLARKYRPQTFADLIGQEVLVRTLTNSIKSGKLAQSYILTGIRGIGKTTSARIIAKALNCIGADGKGTETPTPCGVCEHCKAIAEDRHVDVQEIDAASNTGVDNIREIIEGTRYNPASARYKIYIIDEVHMLSKSAFNALLKTLEEPPEKVKFIFATTEIRKVPVTVLSRCQRFDLRRIDEELLATHFTNIASKENIEIEEDAVKIIARLADGSVRDGMSLLDQAIAQSEGKVSSVSVREMVGISSKETIINMYEAMLQGNVTQVLQDFKLMYNQGYDPVSVVQDLLNLTHLFTKTKLKAINLDDTDLSDNERAKISEISNQIGMPIFTMFWQMLLKGIDEMRIAPSALQTAEMMLIRICYLHSSCPTPELASKIKTEETRNSYTSASSASGGIGTGGATTNYASPSAAIASNSVGNLALSSSPTIPAPRASINFETFNDVVAHAAKQNEMGLTVAMRNDIKVTKFEQGLIEFIPNEDLALNFDYKLAKKLLEWTNKRWVVKISDEKPNSAKTIKEQEVQALNDLREEIKNTPIVSEILAHFPEAKIIEFTKIEEEDNNEPQSQEYEEDLI